MECRSCNSENIVKYGKNSSGNQRYRCKECFSITVDNASFNWLSDSEKCLIDLLFKEGMSMRGIASKINRNYNCVFYYISNR